MSEEFLALPFEDVLELVSRDELNVKSEEQVCVWAQSSAEPLVSLEDEAEAKRASFQPRTSLEHFVVNVPLNLPSRSSSGQAELLWDVSALLRICQCKRNRACL